VLAAWSEERGVRLEFIQPGKPQDTSLIRLCGISAIFSTLTG